MRSTLVISILLLIVSMSLAAPALYLIPEEPAAAIQAVPLVDGEWLVVGEAAADGELIEPLREGYYYLFYGLEAPAGVEVVDEFTEAYLLFSEAPLPGFVGGELVLLHPNPIEWRPSPPAQAEPPAPFGGGEVDAALLDRIAEPTYLHDIEELVAIPTRYSYTAGCGVAAVQISDKLSAWGYEPYYHEYEFGAQGNVAVWDIDAFDTQTAYAVTRSVAIKTTDGGASWNALDDTMGFYMRTCHLDADGTLYIAAFDNLMISRDGGENFTTIRDCWPSFAIDLRFDDAGNGWACGREFVSWTNDGGENWTMGVGDLDRTFYGMSVWGDTLLAVGDSGAIRRSTDGGVNWTNIDSGTTERLYSVSFGDANNVWAVGTGGTIRYSGDAGLTWSEQTSAFQLELFRVEFLDNQVGYAACYNQTVLKTTDGGANWTIVCSDDGSLIRLHALEVIDAESFWIGGGDPPFVYYSTDSGATLIGGEIDLAEDLAWRNVICELHAEDDTKPALLLTGHYDSISDDPFNLAPGANDNGSGVTAMLAVARAFYDQTFATPVRLVFFSGEEQGLIGSSYYVAEMIAQGEVGGVINLDMYSYRDDEELDLQAYTEDGSLWLSGVYKESVEGYSAATVVETNDPNFRRSDHASFWSVGIPAIQIGEYPGTEWYPYYHTTQDILQYVCMEQALAGATGAAAAVMTLVPRVEGTYDTAGIYTYPNPFRPYRGDDTIIFRNVPAGATLSIFDLTGALVYETTVTGEPFTWSGVNQAGAELASGVYLYHVKTPDTTQTGKLAIVR